LLNNPSTPSKLLLQLLPHSLYLELLEKDAGCWQGAYLHRILILAGREELLYRALKSLVCFLAI
jgi:hypothetical protein